MTVSALALDVTAALVGAQYAPGEVVAAVRTALAPISALDLAYGLLAPRALPNLTGPDLRALLVGAGVPQDEADGVVALLFPQPVPCALFWSSQHATSRIVRMTPEGRSEWVLDPWLDMPKVLAADGRNRRLYFGGYGSAAAIGRMNFDGSQVVTVVDQLRLVMGLAVDPDAGYLFWSHAPGDNWRGAVMRSNLDGGDIRVLVDNLFQPRGVTLDTRAKRLYWRSGDADYNLHICSATYDGDDVKRLAPFNGSGDVDNLVVDPTGAYLYFTGRGGLSRMPLEGGGFEPIHFPDPPAGDGGLTFLPGTRRIVWTDSENGRLWSVDATGANPVLVAEGLDQPSDVTAPPLDILPPVPSAPPVNPAPPAPVLRPGRLLLAGGAFVRVSPQAAWNFGVGDFSVAARFKTTQAGTLLARKSTEGGSPACAGWLVVLGPDGSVKFATDNGYGFNELRTAPTSALDGAWHSVVATRRSGVLQVAIDGQPIDGAQGGNLGGPLDVSSGLELRLGSAEQRQEPFGGFAGVLGHAGLWSRALADDEIRTWPTPGDPAPANGLVGYWPLDGDLADHSPTGAAGEPVGPVDWEPGLPNEPCIAYTNIAVARL